MRPVVQGDADDSAEAAAVRRQRCRAQLGLRVMIATPRLDASWRICYHHFLSANPEET